MIFFWLKELYLKAGLRRNSNSAGYAEHEKSGPFPIIIVGQSPEIFLSIDELN